MLHPFSQSSIRSFHQALFFSLDNRSHYRRIVLRIHKSPLHYLRCSTCTPRSIVFCFYLAVVCSGLLVGCTPFIRVSCVSRSPLHDLFLVLSRHDQMCCSPLPVRFFHRCFCLPVVSFCFRSPREGLRISSPRIYIIHPPPRYFIVKRTHLPIVCTPLMFSSLHDCERPFHRIQCSN